MMAMNAIDVLDNLKYRFIWKYIYSHQYLLTAKMNEFFDD